MEEHRVLHGGADEIEILLRRRARAHELVVALGDARLVRAVDGDGGGVSLGDALGAQLEADGGSRRTRRPKFRRRARGRPLVVAASYARPSPSGRDAGIPSHLPAHTACARRRRPSTRASACGSPTNVTTSTSARRRRRCRFPELTTSKDYIHIRERNVRYSGRSTLLGARTGGISSRARERCCSRGSRIRRAGHSRARARVGGGRARCVSLPATPSLRRPHRYRWTPARPPLDVRVLRVSQIDAGRLDAELTPLLREQLLRVFARVHPGAVARRTPNSPSASTCSCSTSPCGLTAPPPAWS